MDTKEQSITLMGLGTMGRAVARAYSNKGHQVHAWNRGQKNRDLDQEMNLKNVIVCDKPTEAVKHSSRLVLMMNAADEMLATAESVIRSVEKSVWKNKTLVQFASHEPFAIEAQEKLMTSLEATLVGCAVMAVATTVGTTA